MIIHTEMKKFKEHMHNTGMDYGEKKSQCLYFQTREWDKKQRCWRPLVATIVDAMENLRNFPQISTGLHHYERQIIVVDIDNENWSEYENAWVGKFPQFSYRLENPETHHVQYGWLLTEPLSNKDGLFRAIKRALPKTINALINKHYKTDGKLADEAFTGWRCKNPLYDKFTNVILHLDKTTSIEDLIGCIDIDSIPDTVHTGDMIDSIKKVSSENGIRNALSSRNDYMVTVFGEEIWNIFRKKGKDVRFDYIKKVGLKFAEDAGLITGKGKEELNIIERQIVDIYRWRYDNFNSKSFYNDIQLRLANLNNKYNFFKRICNVILTLNKRSLNDLDSSFISLLYNGVKNIKRAERLQYVNDKTWSRIKNLNKQEFRNDIEEYVERIEFAKSDRIDVIEARRLLKLYDLFFNTSEMTQHHVIKRDSFKEEIETNERKMLDDMFKESIILEDRYINDFKITDISFNEDMINKIEEILKRQKSN